MVELEHFEPRFWGLDPVFSARVKLNIIDILSLQSHPTVPGGLIIKSVLIIHYAILCRSILHFEPSCSECAHHWRCCFNPEEIANGEV
jgi:hypothetical protein